MSFLDNILGYLNSGNAAPISAGDDRFTAGAPSSGMLSPPMMSAPAAMPMPQPPAFPGGVPMPRPRPLEAGPQASDLSMTPPPKAVSLSAQDAADDDAADAADGNGLLGAVTGAPGFKDKLGQVMVALGGGLSKVQNSPFKGQAFAQPMGGALLAGNKEEQDQFKQRLAALDRALKLKGIEQLGAYRDDLSDAKTRGLGIQQQRVDNQADAAADRNGVAQQNANTRAGVAPSTIARNNAQAGYYGSKANGGTASDRVKRAEDETNAWYLPRSRSLDAEALRIQNAPAGTMDTEARKAAMDDVKRRRGLLDQTYDEYKQRTYVKHGLNPDGTAPEPVAQPTPAAPGRQSAAGKPAEISMNGQGTRDAPYSPQTKDDYDQIESGSYYTAPDGSVRLKK